MSSEPSHPKSATVVPFPEQQKPKEPSEEEKAAHTEKIIDIMKFLDTANIVGRLEQVGEETIQRIGGSLMALLNKKKISSRDAIVLTDQCTTIAANNLQDVVKKAIDFFDERLSAEELRGIVGFLQSPIGQKYLEVTSVGVRFQKELESEWEDQIVKPALEKLREHAPPSLQQLINNFIQSAFCTNPDHDHDKDGA